MFFKIYSVSLLEKIVGENIIPMILIGVSVMLLMGFLLTRLTKPLKLPNVTAYIFAGIILGPVLKIFYKPGFISKEMINSMGFLTDLSLAFIAFGVGRFLKLDVLKKSGNKIIIITLFESLIAALVVFLTMFLIGKATGLIEWKFALLLAAIASATAPASTMMTIRQTKSKGDFVNTILQVVTLDDAVSLILFSVSMAVITADGSNKSGVMVILLPILMTILSVVIGLILGVLLHLIVNRPNRSVDNRLILTVAFLMIFSGVAFLIEVSPLLGVMAMGMAYINVSKDESLFRQIEYFSPIFLTIFFVMSGMRLELESLATIGWIGIVYFVVRIIGKYGGATLGSVAAKSTENNKKYLGLALIPQAGVSLGLAASGSAALLAAGLPNEAIMLSTIIISSGVLYEIFGPPSAKLSLYLSKSYEISDDKSVK
ncbi:cation:proton antiporter [Haploplasma modicum]|uniref:cation:proton antiporter n=1 Tax=Haploplasma modicum TaxID=2150 RepID=UPI00214B8291|nr:cation:proton antiporter [Haploplasma modicum]MCR1809479.1 cation:proton antiporter [Haploplasma modicum]